MAQQSSPDRRDNALAFISDRLGQNPDIPANELARELKAHGLAYRRQDMLRDIRDFAEFLGMSGRQTRRETTRFAPDSAQKRKDAFEVLSIARREKVDRAAAVRLFNTNHPFDPISARTVQRYVGKAFEKRGGRWNPTSYDRLTRVQPFLTPHGKISLPIRDSRSASRIGSYWNAVQTFLETGDDRGLRQFRGKSVRSNNITYPFITDPETLIYLAEADELRFDLEEFGS